MRADYMDNCSCRSARTEGKKFRSYCFATNYTERMNPVFLTGRCWLQKDLPYIHLTAEAPVYREALTWPFTDPDRIILMGASQGAFSAAVTASRHPGLFAAVILMYGAYVILDDVRNMFPDKESVPDPFDYRGWSMMGACYLTDLWDFDLKELGEYRGPVLVLHGDDDPLVDPSYSQNVAKIYENAEFHLISGGRHGFKKGAFEEAAIYIKAFLTNNINFVDVVL